MTKHFLLLIVCSIFIITSGKAQEKEEFKPAKNVIHGSLGTFILLYSAQLNYDKLLIKDDGFFKAYYLSAKGGRNAYVDFGGNSSGTGYVASLGATALTGSGKNHFELGIGLGRFFDSIIEDEETDINFDNDESRFYPSISIGYRKQTSNGFMFRTGIGAVEWAYVGFGYSF